MTRRVIFDTETTGLKFDGPDRIIEIACVEMEDTTITGAEYQSYVNPRVTMHPDAFKVHGISDAFLSDKPEFDDIVDELMSFIADAELVAHNAKFDIGFLNKELRLLGREPISNHVIDTLSMARRRRPHKRNNLDSLASDFRVSSTRVDGVHGALEDAKLLAKVFCHLVQTGGSNELVLEAQATASDLIDTSAIRTRIIEPTAEEYANHLAACLEMGIKPVGGSRGSNA